MSDAKHDQHGKKDAGHGSSGAGGKGGHGDEGSGKKKHGGHGGGGHGAPHEEHEGAPEWLISFADMVMLMMGFFVILFALNVQPKGGNPGGAGEEAEGVALSPAQLDYVIALRHAFNNPVDPMGMDPDDARLRERMKASEQGGAWREPRRWHRGQRQECHHRSSWRTQRSRNECHVRFRIGKLVQRRAEDH